MKSEDLASNIQKYLEQNLYIAHQKNSFKKNSKLSSYKINPLTIRYLSKTLDGGYTPRGVAMALYYPRVLGTSLVTTFGTVIQKMFIELNIAESSLLSGMDIQFIDQLDGHLKYCQLKAGPNTLNSIDVSPMKSKFDKIRNRARTNGERINNEDMIVGVIYGNRSDLSRHYQNIDKTYPVYVGADLWFRLTGLDDVYSKIEFKINSLIEELELNYNLNDETREKIDYFNKGLRILTKEVERSELFNFKE